MKNLLRFILPVILATQMTARAGRIEIRSTGQGAGSIHLREDAVNSAQSGPVATGLTSRALASADFDEDGMPDLVTGYATTGTGGTISIQRGNVDAVYPNSPEAKARRQGGEFTAGAFLPEVKSFAVPEAADFIGAGDFDADGHWDIVTARNGGDKLYWFRGDGRGGRRGRQRPARSHRARSLLAGERRDARHPVSAQAGDRGAAGVNVGPQRDRVAANIGELLLDPLEFRIILAARHPSRSPGNRIAGKTALERGNRRALNPRNAPGNEDALGGRFRQRCDADPGEGRLQLDRLSRLACREEWLQALAPRIRPDLRCPGPHRRPGRSSRPPGFSRRQPDAPAADRGRPRAL